jgi:phage terminase large subunit-like protein
MTKKPTPDELKKIRDTLKAAANIKRFRKLDFYVAYPKQQEFHAMGAVKRERLLMAGNQNGKTYSGAAEAAYHLTGEYPEWWTGRRFDHPVKAWIAGESSTLVRDQPQTLLCGTPGVKDDIGTGLIPKESLKDYSLARGVTDAYDTIQVIHKTNGVIDGISTATFKSYEQGRQKFQSATLDFLWLDEECDEEIYQECLARITATRGMLFMTFTPLKGRSAVVIRYMDEPNDDRGIVHMTIEDALHIDATERAKIIEGYLPHQRDARARGIPLMGSGVIFTVPEENVKEPQLQHVPSYWAKLWGIDFGIGHPFAAALILWDKDNDIIHVHHAFKMAGELPIMHASAMKPIGIEVPVAWPQDGTQREKGSGDALHLLYKAEGLRTLHEHATWPEGGNSTEAGVEEIRQREASGKIKYAAHLSELLEERRFYHRKDGQIVKTKDDILSAVRVAVMMKRFAKSVMLGGKRSAQQRSGNIAKGVDFDYF